ncbi:hypothetical protein OIV83_005370 [Microbotryomycetes sp. JL201]|nr:hypothetical protein OIV83_005370 [Microbotryomycetes sp. JL201]
MASESSTPPAADEAPQGGGNLKRAVLACTECRVRKCKCDAVQAGCHYCVINGRTCTYVPVTFEENLAARAKKKLGHPSTSSNKKRAAPHRRQQSRPTIDRKIRTSSKSPGPKSLPKTAPKNINVDLVGFDVDPWPAVIAETLDNGLTKVDDLPMATLTYAAVTPSTTSAAPHTRVNSACDEPEWLSGLFSCSPASGDAWGGGYSTPALSDMSSLSGFPFGASLPTTPMSGFKDLQPPLPRTHATYTCGSSQTPPVVTSDSLGFCVWMPVVDVDDVQTYTYFPTSLPATSLHRPIDLELPPLISQTWPLPPLSPALDPPPDLASLYNHTKVTSAPLLGEHAQNPDVIEPFDLLNRAAISSSFVPQPGFGLWSGQVNESELLSSLELDWQ